MLQYREEFKEYLLEGKKLMVAMRNGKPIEEGSFENADVDRAEAMRKWHAGQREEVAPSQSGGMNTRWTPPRKQKHNRNFRV